jgi:hypothetical protein
MIATSCLITSLTRISFSIEEVAVCVSISIPFPYHFHDVVATVSVTLVSMYRQLVGAHREQSQRIGIPIAYSHVRPVDACAV